MIRLPGILIILTSAFRLVYSQGDDCALETSISCTITQWGIDHGKGCFDEVTGRSNIIRPANGEEYRDVAVKLKYKICKGNHFDQIFTFNTNKTRGGLRGENVGLASSSIPESVVCVSETIHTSINTYDDRTPASLMAKARTPEGSWCRSYTYAPIVLDKNYDSPPPQPCELETFITCTIKEGNNMDKPCEGNLFYDNVIEIGFIICNPVSVEFKYEICKGNATQETIPYYFNRKRTSASLRKLEKTAESIALNVSPLSEMCRSEIVSATISACQGPVVASMDARAQIGNDDHICTSYSRLDIMPAVA